MGQDQRTTTRQRPWKSSTEILASSRFPKMLPDSTCSHSPSQWIPLTSIPSHQSTSLKRMATRSLGQVYILTLDCLILWHLDPLGEGLGVSRRILGRSYQCDGIPDSNRGSYYYHRRHTITFG